jgi:hypothetical protein
MAFKFNLAAYQRELLRTQHLYRMLILYYRRQSRKTSTCAVQGLDWMLSKPGVLVTFATCSLNLGAEMTEREIDTIHAIVEAMKAGAGSASADVMLDTHLDGKNDDWLDLDWSDVADLYTKSKLEVKLYHSQSTYSRTKIIAPNIATARGFSGYVILDEIGFIRDFKGFFEAVEPIIASDPTFRLWMSTTPPEDDSHFSYELLAAPPDLEFEVNPAGNWYFNEHGMPVHRVDAWDASAAGVPLYSTRTGEKVTPDQHRSIAVDKDAWDRNYGLQPPMSGKSAVTLTALHAAQVKGRELGCRWLLDDLPPDWQANLDPDAETVIGVDPATTEKDKSNPTGLSITQDIDSLFAAKILMRYKIADPKKARAILREIAVELQPRCIVIDATSERYWCAETKADLEGICPVILVVNSEWTEHNSEKMIYKTYIGNLAVNAMEDYQSAIPPDKSAKDDFRLVRRFKGGFLNELDSSGNHGDTFDAYKNSIYGFFCDLGVVDAAAVPCGRSADPVQPRSNRLSMHPDHSADSTIASRHIT